MRLVKEDILNIDKYLKNKGIKYMDVRYELIDHLVSEYEQLENYPDLESFLQKRVAWCRQIAEEKEKSIHKGYQKALWQRIFSFIKEPLFYACLLLWSILLYTANFFFSTKEFVIFLFLPLLLCVIVQLINLFYKQLGKKNILSYKYLFNIYSLPHLFLYLHSMINEFKPAVWFWVFYATLGFVVNIAALLEVFAKRKKVLEEYEFLKIYFS